MKFLSGILVGFMGFFFREEAPKMFCFSINRYSGLPATTTFFDPRGKANTFNAMFAVCFAVSPILPICRFSQIFKTIVRSISIYVVNHFRRHFSSFVHPHKPVGRVMFPVYFQIDIPFMVKVARFSANSNFTSRRFPEEITRFRVVIKNLGQFFMCQHERDFTRFCLRLQCD